jgi:thioredoxin 1
MKLAAVALGATLALLANFAQALDSKAYSAAALAEAQSAGKPVALHFHADWCPTCRTQEKAFKSMSAEPGLDITLLVVNYDTEIDLKRSLRVRSQSTLIVYKGRTETARLAGDTNADALRKALKSAL